MVKGETYSKQLFENEAFRHFMKKFLSDESGVTKGCELTQTSSTITISAGYFFVLGGLLREKTGTTLELPTEAGYYKLVYEIDLSKTNTKESFEQGSYKFIKGTGNYPSLTQENLDEGGTIYQFEFCRFRITDSGITDYKDTRVIFTPYGRQKETVLFEGSSTNITLSDDYANYDELLVEVGWSDRKKTYIITNPKEDYVLDTEVAMYDGWYYLCNSTFKLRQNNRMRVDTYWQVMGTNGLTNGVVESKIYIKKVVGVKKGV